MASEEVSFVKMVWNLHLNDSGVMMKKNIWIVVFITLASITAHAVEVSKRPFATLGIENKKGATVEYAEFGNSLFINSGGALYVAKKVGNLLKPAKLVKALSSIKNINSIAVLNGRLFIVKDGIDSALEGANYPAEARSLLEPLILAAEKDQAELTQFKPNDASTFQRDVRTDFGDFKEFSKITQIKSAKLNGKDALIVNAGVGSSAWASYNDGKSWSAIVKGTEEWGNMCYVPSFEVVGKKVFFGGECPTDMAYITYGELLPSGQIQNVKPVKLLGKIDNRMIQFIRQSPYNSKLMFAGVEGGLMVSRNGGASWSFSYFEDVESVARKKRSYPYITSLIFPDPARPNIVLMGGHPQSGLGTLMISVDAGKTWKDLSESLLKNAEFLSLGMLKDKTIILSSRKMMKPDSFIFSTKANAEILTLKP